MVKLGLSVKGLEKPLLSAVSGNAECFNAQDVANTLNAMAKLGLSVKGLKEQLLSAVLMLRILILKILQIP